LLKILHTADWHLGRSFGIFDPDDAQKLARDRLSVIDRILGVADQRNVDAVLCAGDLFDNEHPDKDWWDGLAEAFKRFGGRKNWTRKVILLPGNHDPLTKDSVYCKSHPFRKVLPDWVHVVDRPDFEIDLPQDAVVYAQPCTCKAGDKDLAMSLPDRAPDDHRVRIGLVHGSTFDQHQERGGANFPVSLEAPQVHGLDYLAIGDTHSYHEFTETPIVYPGTPEPTSFNEHDPGYVAVVWFKRHGARPQVQKERVARWTWRDEAVHSMPELNALVAGDLYSTVLRLRLDLTVSLSEVHELDRIVSSLKGTTATNARAGAFVCDRSNLRLDVERGISLAPDDPQALCEAAERLRMDASASDEATADEARQALVILQRILHEVR
jgi:DNA repair exonuclease SbcCD nuclease subunit